MDIPLPTWPGPRPPRSLMLNSPPWRNNWRPGLQAHPRRPRASVLYAGGDITDSTARRLPQGLAERLRTAYASSTGRPAARQVAADGTTKLLFRLADGRAVESVLMPGLRADRAAGCLSSQAGCAMAVISALRPGAVLNATSPRAEIVEQFLALRREAHALGRRLQTVVFMGMVNPLLNLEAVLPAVHRLADNSFGGLGWRQITVSTVGIVPGIEALTATGLNLQLAVSLHAPDDATRTRLLPMGSGFHRGHSRRGGSFSGPAGPTGDDSVLPARRRE